MAEVVKTVENVDKLFSQIVVNGEVYESDKFVPVVKTTSKVTTVTKNSNGETTSSVKTSSTRTVSVPQRTIQGEDVHAVELNDVLHNFVDSAVTEGLENEVTARQEADQTLQDNISVINELIPVQASPSNKLADKASVDSAIGTAVASAINDLDVAQSGGNGKYIKAISETDGKISATEGTIDSSVTSGSDNPVTGGAVSKAISNAVNALDVAQSGGNGKYIKAISETDGKISATEGTIDSSVTSGSDNPVTGGAVSSAISPVQASVSDIEALIPAQATTQNQLADKNFVNSSIATNTANFLGTYTSLAEIEAIQNPTNNDYAFLQITDQAGNSGFDRYKYNAEQDEWLFEYELNNSSFTAEQWATINSGLTSSSISDAINALDVAQSGGNGKYIKAISEANGKISATEGTIDSSVTSGSSNPVTGGAVDTALAGKKNTQTAKTDPTASGNSITFIDTITQNENGEITATKKTVRSASTSQSGVVQLSDSYTGTGSTKAVTEKALSDGLATKQASGNYKTTQTAKTDPTASGNSITFIDTITQNANGEITATKKTVRSASTSQSGVVQLNDTLTSDSTTQALTAKQGKALKTALDAIDASNKMDKANPTGTGSFSLNRKASTTVGTNSFAEGSGGTASGDYSHAEGFSCTASGTFSHAEGHTCKANGNYGSHAVGYYCTASGMASHAEGGYCTASGSYSHAQGDHCTASGSASHAEGWQCTASGDYSHAQGQFNVIDNAYADVIGNGTSPSARKNIEATTWTGDKKLKGDVYVGCNDDSTGGIALGARALRHRDISATIGMIARGSSTPVYLDNVTVSGRIFTTPLIKDDGTYEGIFINGGAIYINWSRSGHEGGSGAYGCVGLLVTADDNGSLDFSYSPATTVGEFNTSSGIITAVARASSASGAKSSVLDSFQSYLYSSNGTSWLRAKGYDGAVSASPSSLLWITIDFSNMTGTPVNTGGSVGLYSIGAVPSNLRPLEQMSNGVSAGQFHRIWTLPTGVLTLHK